MRRPVISDRMFSMLLLLIVLTTTIAFDIIMLVAVAKAQADAPAAEISSPVSNFAVHPPTERPPHLECHGGQIPAP
ncbi:MAG: hypothetical protein JW720_00940 [Sedimentisphaerales bacterium]|nr:hypothetical protein [Sedimentisphaerales bacterium]